MGVGFIIIPTTLIFCLMTRIFAKTKHFPKHFSAHIQLKLVDVDEKYYHHIINFITAHDHMTFYL